LLFNLFKKKIPRPDKKPKHIAVIMDGNGRWAKKKLLPRISGHKQGIVSVEKTIELALKYKISTLTLYAFSTENWSRPTSEVNGLMSLFTNSITKQFEKLNNENILVRIIGDISIFHEPLQIKIKSLESKTSKNTALTLNIALNYGGRSEIVNSVNSFYSLSKNKGKKITQKNLNDLLYTKDSPEVDLLIRTGGQRRLSNFLLWQIAYSELYFIDTLWPDFSEKDFVNALCFFQNTERKFGNLKRG